MVIRIAQGYLLVGCLLVSDLVAGQNPDVHAAAIPGKIASRVFSMPLRHCLPDRLVGLALLAFTFPSSSYTPSMLYHFPSIYHTFVTICNTFAILSSQYSHVIGNHFVSLVCFSTTVLETYRLRPELVYYTLLFLF